MPAVELFSAARWGAREADVGKVEERVLAELDVELPTRFVQVRVPLERALYPNPTDRLELLLRAYSRIVSARASASEESEVTRGPARTGEGGMTRVPVCCDECAPRGASDANESEESEVTRVTHVTRGPARTEEGGMTRVCCDECAPRGASEEKEGEECGEMNFSTRVTHSTHAETHTTCALRDASIRETVDTHMQRKRDSGFE